MAIPEIIQRYLDAYNARDVDALLDAVTDDVVFEHVSVAADPVRVEGKAALGDLARQSAAAFSSRVASGSPTAVHTPADLLPQSQPRQYFSVV